MGATRAGGRRAVAAVDGACAALARRSCAAAARRSATRSSTRPDTPRRCCARHAALHRSHRDAACGASRPAGRRALVAVGGYGRGELFPHSDVDVLVLLPDDAATRRARRRVERFVGALWDVGLEIGHSVRTVAQCVSEAQADVTVRTSLLEIALPGRQSRRCSQRLRRRARGGAGRARVLRGQGARAAAAPRSSTTTRPTTSSPTSRKARAACATCRWSSGSRAPRASGAPGASSPRTA